MRRRTSWIGAAVLAVGVAVVPGPVVAAGSPTAGAQPAPRGPVVPAPVSLAPAAVLRTAVSPLTLPTVRRTMLRCSSWSFVPLSTTTCRAGKVVAVSVRISGTTVWAWSTSRRAWVAIAYSWNPAHRRLEIDQRKLRIAAPPPGTTATVWRYTCSAWTLTAGRTTCSAGRPQRVRVRFPSLGAPASVLDAVRGSYLPSPYRWLPLGGYLVLDAMLLPVATVDLGPTMTPRPDPSVTDFVVSCPTNGVTAQITARGGGAVVVDGQAPRTATTSVRLALAPGQAVRWTLRLPGRTAVQQQARCLPADFPAWNATRTGTPSSQWYVLAPTLGLGAAAAGAPLYVVVVDDRGTPVWWKASTTHRPIDAKLAPGGGLLWTEAGYAYSLAAIYHRVGWDGSAQGDIGDGLGIDQHELVPAQGGGWYAIRYVVRNCVDTNVDCADMTAFGGSAQATIIDGEVVRIDGSGAIVWTWSTRDHVPFSEWADLVPSSHIDQARQDIGGHDYWDIVHLNSVEDDGDGILVSSRHLDAVYRIRKADGSVDWKLGGTPTARSLGVLGGDRYPFFNSQHDARRLPNGHLTVFDNGSEGLRIPRALELTVDPVARTAAVVRSVQEPRQTFSPCCGSTRAVGSGGFVTAWGGTGLITETDASGRPVLSIDYGAVFSYRAVPVAPGQVSRATLQAGMDAMYPRVAG